MAGRSICAFAASVTVEDLETDPSPVYARLRREAPVCFILTVGLWFITVDGALHQELRRALDAKYRPRHVNT